MSRISDHFVLPKGFVHAACHAQLKNQLRLDKVIDMSLAYYPFQRQCRCHMAFAIEVIANFSGIFREKSPKS